MDEITTFDFNWVQCVGYNANFAWEQMTPNFAKTKIYQDKLIPVSKCILCSKYGLI